MVDKIVKWAMIAAFTYVVVVVFYANCLSIHNGPREITRLLPSGDSFARRDSVFPEYDDFMKLIEQSDEIRVKGFVIEFGSPAKKEFGSITINTDAKLQNFNGLFKSLKFRSICCIASNRQLWIEWYKSGNCLTTITVRANGETRFEEFERYAKLDTDFTKDLCKRLQSHGLNDFAYCGLSPR